MEVGSFNFRAKQVIFKEGQLAKELYRVEDGEVLCVKYVNNRIVPVMLVRKGQSFGHSAMVTGAKYMYSAIALSFTTTSPYSQTTFAKEFKATPGWMGKLIENMVNRFEHTANLLAENRIIHPTVFNEEDFTASFEIELKRLLGYVAGTPETKKKGNI